jgi:hypothetical protein
MEPSRPGSVEVLVDLPAPSCRGTYFALVEPGVVKIGTSACVSRRLIGIRTGTFRRVALLAWTSLSERYVHDRFEGDRITFLREFFRLSPELLSYINECRVTLGFLSVEEVLLWEFGGPLPLGQAPEENLALPPSWEGRISALPPASQVLVGHLLRTERFRSEKRRKLKGRVLEWLDSSEVGLLEFLTPEERATLRGVPLREGAPRMSEEEMARLGRYHTHLRWHKNPKPSCEFCSHPAPPRG